jgi:hypothetical protein
MVKEIAEDEDVEYIAEKQEQMVWHRDVGGCASWVSFLSAWLMSVLRREDGTK